jgi:hypothetical protein
MLALLLLLAAEGHYVVPKPGQPFDHAPLRLMPMSDTRPKGLKVKVSFRGKKQRYGWLQYGRGKLAAVAVVADEIAPGKIDLYVDAARKDVITASCLVKDGRVEIDAIIPKWDDVERHRRVVLFRWGKVTHNLAVATCGYVECEATLDGKKARVLRIDCDANGLFSDPQDRLVIGDEEMPFGAIVRLGERRIVVRADAVGRMLALSPLSGTGTIKLSSTLKASEAMVTLQSRDGIVATIRQADGKAALPPGEYRVSSVLLTLPAKDGGAAWGYVFGDNGGKAPRWHKVTKGGTVTIDPIGKLDFGIEVKRNGDNATVDTRLYTGEGLLIEKAYRGSFDGFGCHAVIVLNDGDRYVDRATSGFA